MKFLIKMLKSLTLVIFILSNTYLSAQNIVFNWQNCILGYENEEFDVCPHDIVNTGDGFLMVLTYQTPVSAVPPEICTTDIWLVKLDKNGNFLWDKFFGGSKNESPGLIIKSGDGNYYIIGATSSSDGDIGYDPYPNSADFWVLKIDSIGNLIWERIIGGTSGERLDNTDAYSESDGGIVFIGTTLSNDGDITQNYGTYDMWMVKLNADGSKAWDFSAGTPGFEYCAAMIPTSDGGYLLGGNGTPVEGGNISCVSSSLSKPDGIILKLDSNRNIEWQQCLQGSEYDGVGALLETQNGYIIGLWSSSNDGDFANSGYHFGSDLVLRRTDYSGNLIWQKCYGGSKDEYIGKIFNLSDGNIMVFGYVNSIDGDVTGLHYDPAYPQYTYRDIWMLKIKAENGDILWQRCIGANDIDDFTEGIIQINDSDYVICAQTQYGMMGDIACGPYPSNKLWSWVMSVTDTVTWTNLPDYGENIHEVHLSPNPANENLLIDIPEHLRTNAINVEIINSFGVTLKKTELDGKIPFLQINDLQPGIYLLKLDNGKMKTIKRFIKI